MFNWFRCKQGEKGDQGIQGIPGEKGADGKDGLNGTNTGTGVKTIVDYGAKSYKWKWDAVDNSCHNAMLDMLDDVGCVVLPEYGSFNHEGLVPMFKVGSSISSLSNTNRNVNLVSTKPISMFLPIHQYQTIKGFTASYLGNGIDKECAVVQLGGSELNIGGENYNSDVHIKNGDNYEILPHFWARRTQSQDLTVDIDFHGDKRYYNYSTNNPDSFVENGNAHVVWVNFDEENEHNKSFCQGMRIKGIWKWVNTGVKIRRREGTQTLNTFDIAVKIWGARKFLDIEDINFSRIKMMGQERAMLSPGEIGNVDLGNIKNSHRIMYDGFVYDVGDARKIIFDNVTDIELEGWLKMHTKEGNTPYAHKFNECTFK